MDNITLLKHTRALMQRVCVDMDEATITTIPQGWNNNILWHVGHVVVTQQILCYKLSGNDMCVEQAYVDTLLKGSAPTDWTKSPDWKCTLALLIELAQRLEADYVQGIFSNFTEYPTSAGITLTSIDDAIAFNNFHEGIHMGFILALKRILA